MPRFVVLEHDSPVTHWDFMLETDGVLRTWRLRRPPTSGQAIAADILADHRLFYLDHEGPVSGGRGNVMRWDTGVFEWEMDSPLRVEVRLAGNRLSGRAVVAAAQGSGWSFVLLP
jgi:hypothetical protein